MDLERALGDSRELDEAVLSLPETGIVTTNIGRDVELDVSTPEKQHARGLIPVTVLFDTSLTIGWLIAYTAAATDSTDRDHRQTVMSRFNAEVIAPLSAYRIPSIELDKDISKEAVATVFEKVNTGGLRLDTFELLTATFAGDRAYFERTGEDFRLADDWRKTKEIISQFPTLKSLRNTDFLQVVSVLTSLEARQRAIKDGRTGKNAPQTTARREDILNMDLVDYERWAPKVRKALLKRPGFRAAPMRVPALG